jgi:hypothetical protein
MTRDDPVFGSEWPRADKRIISEKKKECPCLMKRAGDDTHAVNL